MKEYKVINHVSEDDIESTLNKFSKENFVFKEIMLMSARDSTKADPYYLRNQYRIILERDVQESK
jgi:hypothetical protein